MRTPHSSTYKGKRVYVILRDGTEFVDKFVDKKGRFVYFETHGRVRIQELRVFTIYKNRVI
jgi:hypothetical protein